MSDPVPAIELHPGLRPLLDHMRKIEASVLYLAGDCPPVFRVNDVTYPSRIALPAGEVAAMADSFMTEEQRAAFRTDWELNLALRLEDDARYRVNLHYRGGLPALVIRALPARVLSLDELGVPPILKQLATKKRGLCVITGENAGARASLFAAMLDHRNAAESGHILTIEDPIEFQHAPKQCVVTQREIGRDTHSYYDGLRNAPRQTPDLIAIGEIRDAETMDSILTLSETGHACLATLYASSVSQAIERMVAFFPEASHGLQRPRLARALRGVICERAVATLQGGRALALQIATDAPAIRESIQRGALDGLDLQLEQHPDAGCRSFEASLLELVASGRVHDGEALRWVTDEAGFRAKLERQRAAGAQPASAAGATLTLRLAPDPYEAAAVAAAAPVAEKRTTKVGPARG